MNKVKKILLFFFLLLPLILAGQNNKDSKSSSSVLSSGKWFKIAVTEDGIYRIDYSKLSQLGLDNPGSPKIFCNNTGQLSYYNNDPSPDDLKECSLYFSGNDDVLNEGEYLLFYGEGTCKWIYNDTIGEYRFLRHNYSDTAYYFITSMSTPGKRITNSNNSALSDNYSSSESDALFIHEKEDENLIKSGRDWFQPISVVRGVTINPGFTDLIPSEKIRYNIRVAGRASVSTIFRLYEGESLKKSIQVEGVNLFASTGTFAQVNDSTGTISSGSTSPEFEIKYYNNGEAGAEGWIDYVKLQGRRSNTFYGSFMKFRDSRSVSPGRITRFTINSSVENTIIWNISDPLNISQILYSKNGEHISFKEETENLKTFVAFRLENALQPSIRLISVPNQNLHESSPADMIIVTHPLFKPYAEKLASIHNRNSGLLSLIVTPEQVYNEFSGGIPDIVAIRNFIRMKYFNQMNSSHPLKYLLLFGDGSFENKTAPPNNPNFIPTYQSQNSNVYVLSFTSDDFYGLLDIDEGEAEGTEDIGIGRLPVSDTIQAGIILAKISRYIDPSNIGDWKNVICITADDEDGNTHMSDAEGLSAIINDSVPSYNIDKIYLDAFRQVTSVNGQTYPDVTKAINDRINAGCLIFNYVGHGSENGLAHERVVKTDDINSWKNSEKLPLFITATCEFSRFDDIDINIITREMTGKTSAGELVLLNSEGGGIALMSTTRVVYSAPNYFLNRMIFNFAFDRDESGKPLRLGDIIRLAKNNSGSGPNKRNFSLLGDPALRLAYPHSGNVVTDSINNVNISVDIDTLKALSLITVSGHIENEQGTLMDSFNGVVSPLIYDKESKLKTLANDGGNVMEFSMRNNIVFSGKTSVKNGRFRFSFIVPRDIDYSYGNGKISYYAYDTINDMNGNFSDIVVGGFSNSIITDSEGPDIKLYMNDTLFRNGGITNNNPTLVAILEDNGGINTSGAGIGHDLTGFLDNDPNRSFILNNYFFNDFDNYMKGKIIYDLAGLTDGNHSLTVKAWDNFNNSSEETVLFLVESDDKFILKNLLNYPNPILNETKIKADHNRPDTDFEVTVKIYNLSGSIIKIIYTKVAPTGFVIPPIIWDGNDDGGKRVGQGIYPYNVTVITAKGERATASGRMIIL